MCSTLLRGYFWEFRSLFLLKSQDSRLNRLIKKTTNSTVPMTMLHLLMRQVAKAILYRNFL